MEELYDLLFLENHTKHTTLIKDMAKIQKLKIKINYTLEEFVITLKQDNAKIYVIDGMFPKRPDEAAWFYAKDAIDIIRQQKGMDVPIILYSFPTRYVSRVEFAEMANRLQVQYIEKEVDSVSGLFEAVNSLKNSY